MRLIFIFSCILILSCEKIETGKSLSKKQIQYIKKLGLLDEGETIIKFYSEYKKRVAGNFFTDKRVAEYWIDEYDSIKNSQHSAFYHEIVSLDTNYLRGSLTFSPYVEVTKKDGTKFRVCAGGKEKDIRSFFEEILSKWKASK